MSYLIPQSIRYACGHSLGPSSMQSQKATQLALKTWETQGVCGWTQADWINLSQKVAHQISGIIGARPFEVAVCDNTTVNLYKAIQCALQLTTRRVILSETDIFPADRYVMSGIANTHPELLLKIGDIEQHLDTDVGILVLSHVHYLSGYCHNMQSITQKAQALGIIVIWDVCHSVGAMPLQLNQIGVDFAVGCTYKYLSGGPGAPAFIFVHEKHHTKIDNPIKSWMAHQEPFAFKENFVAKLNAGAFQTGTPSILGLHALQGALTVFESVDMSALRAQSLVLSNYLMTAVKETMPNITCITPMQRGNHLALEHPHAKQVTDKLIAAGIIVDYRPPNLIRLSLCPLYLTIQDVEYIVNKLKELA